MNTAISRRASPVLRFSCRVQPRQSYSSQASNEAIPLELEKRQRRDNFWVPNAILDKQDEGATNATQLLVRAGYLRQAYSGIYHMLPLGLKVQEKLERLIDKHMASLKASKVSLSSISSQKLWQKSGRLSTGTEFFKFKDRKDAQWLLAPTHEEEITTLVKEEVISLENLPIRLYQISRKYRDEKRPRGGLLRGREFIMKDLYTFDRNEAEARITYNQARQAYRNFLDELKVPYIEARADSGNMGGNLSHEYHFPSIAGEDDVISCSNCGSARNEEWVPEFNVKVLELDALKDLARASRPQSPGVISETYVSKDRTTLCKVFTLQSTEQPVSASFNPYAIKACLKGVTGLDTGVENPEARFESYMSSTQHDSQTPEKARVYYLFDESISNRDNAIALVSKDREWLERNRLQAYTAFASTSNSVTGQSDLTRRTSGDTCPECTKGKLEVHKAIEVGHTFHLGTRYSSKLDLKVRMPTTDEVEYVSMGCHGIGVSRLIAAVASSLADGKGLNWPRVIAPFEAVVIINKADQDKLEVATQVYDALDQSRVDTLLDDRERQPIAWKLKDADLLGYPVIVVVGSAWSKKKLVEIQCRRLHFKQEVAMEDVTQTVEGLLRQL